MLWLFLLPLQAVVLVILHFCFAFSRLLALLRQLSPFPRNSSTSSPLAPTVYEIEEARKRWKKTPRKLSVLFAVGKRWNVASWRRGSKDKEEQVEVAKLASDIGRLVKWSDQLGIEELSLYDERGILDRQAQSIASSLSTSCIILQPLAESPAGFQSFKIATTTRRLAKLKESTDTSPTRAEVDSGCGVSDSGGDGAVSPPPPSSLLINLLSRRAGRPQLARVAQELAHGVRKRTYKSESLTTGVVEEKVEKGTFAEPDLLLVLGGPYLRLRGFPPWQIRLTEMYHHPSPDWLPPPTLAWPVLRRALDLYGGAQMRLGR
ncbi:hypothetical protein BCR35DRAFT_352990 [Leucosporidium creatinivorum]|uniref:ditrans,polycis-polyprenyl diphosphate synthase [(2E,6E)-farnesyldiphosphate specific] n=1 Tax=Leucosporidium creatinivorum TaxID=106004 RepID=A0A1Y2F288_9BASI|nr:hypothetical protein BCR35DRAFT_352990 [Leucosporidium creatinivorum]